MPLNFKQKIISIVSKVPEGKIMSYKKVAEGAGRPRAFRTTANILAKNRTPEIPCHRIVKNDNSVGGYFGSKKLGWKKSALLLKEGVIGVIPTDTIYGICSSALNKKSVKKIYELRKRNQKRPMIILIKSLDDLKLFSVKIDRKRKNILSKFWPGKVSVILKCSDPKFSYLHRGTKTLAFRLPKKRELLRILSISGPLVAPSANWEGYTPAKSVGRAKKYFKNNVFYFNGGILNSRPSMIIDLTNLPLKILRH